MILDIGEGAQSNILKYLFFKDAVQLCYTNKEYYKTLLIFCYKYSYVSLNLKKPEYKKYSSFKNTFEFFEIFAARGGMDKINIHEQIKYAECLKVNNWNSIKLFAPKHLRQIHFGRGFNITWDKNALPDTLEVITIHPKSKFNYNIGAINLPRNLKKICFNAAFNKPIDDLPDTLEEIIFCKNSRFNQFIKKMPSKLRVLHFGDYYNKPLNLPTSLKILHFSNNSKFNEEIKYNYNLEKIYFGKHFNKSINNLLSNTNIRVIKFTNKSEFNFGINAASYTLEYIHFGKTFNQILELEYFTKLTKLKFYLKSVFNSNITLPENIEIIHFGKHFNNEFIVPENTKIIKFTPASKFKQKIITNAEVQWPKNYY